MEGKWLYLGDLSLQFGDSLCPLFQSLLQLWDFSGSQLRQLQQREREGSPTLLLNQEMPSHLLNLWFEFLQLFLPLLLVLKLCVQLWEKLRNTLIQTVRYLLGGGRHWEITTSWDYTPQGWDYFIPCLIPKFTCTRAWEQAYTIMCLIPKFT